MTQFPSFVSLTVENIMSGVEFFDLGSSAGSARYVPAYGGAILVRSGAQSEARGTAVALTTADQRAAEKAAKGLRAGRYAPLGTIEALAEIGLSGPIVDPQVALAACEAERAGLKARREEKKAEVAAAKAAKAPAAPVDEEAQLKARLKELQAAKKAAKAAPAAPAATPVVAPAAGATPPVAPTPVVAPATSATAKAPAARPEGNPLGDLLAGLSPEERVAIIATLSLDEKVKLIRMGLAG